MTRPSSPKPANELLTVPQSATMLDIGRPAVIMLCEAGKLGEVIIGQDGRRRIWASAVRAHLAERKKRQKGVPSPRQAAVEAGLYDLSDEEWKRIARQARASRATTRKTPRR